MGRRLIDISGRRFGRLLATDNVKKVGRVIKRLCRCDCGNDTWQVTNHLTSGHTKSCGCLLGEFKKLPPGRAVRNQILDNYIRGAKDRCLIWNLSENEFDVLISDNCYYCHRPPSTLRKARRMNGDFIYNGIDRLDSGIGYTIDNCVSCCQICNRAKSDLSLEDFMYWVNCLCEAQYVK